MKMKKMTFILLTVCLTCAAGQVIPPTDTVQLKILYPNGGEILFTNAATQIRWTSSISTGKVHLVLFKRGVKHSVISEGTTNNGLFVWKIPPELAEGTDYRVRIRLAENLSVNDFSDGDFTIKKK